MEHALGVLTRLADSLPYRWQNELKRIYYSRQILKGTFASPEPEYSMLPELVRPGDWVMDIGANVGHYSRRFSELVGDSGRVIAFEPVPTTFALLAANVQRFAHANVTLLNAAVSDKTESVGISVPQASAGRKNYYQAHLSPAGESDLAVLSISVDALGIDRRIALIKIDVEGHEAFVVRGMQQLLRRSRPFLVIETSSKEVTAELSALGYSAEKVVDSPNVLFRPRE